MTHTIEFGTAFCFTPTFIINGIEADSDDFGDQADRSPETAEDYGCGDMRFEPKMPTEDVLSKYGIDELEYWTIANKLSDGLSFGSCAWC